MRRQRQNRFFKRHAADIFLLISHGSQHTKTQKNFCVSTQKVFYAARIKSSTLVVVVGPGVDVVAVVVVVDLVVSVVVVVVVFLMLLL